MNESSPKQNRPWLRRACWIWLFLFIAIAVVPAWLDLQALRRGNHTAPYSQQLLVIAVWATLALGLWCLIRWPFTCWRNFRRTLVGLAVFATLLAICYTEEDWRGKRAWENCKRELETKGAVLDWNKYIPPPIPDDQNFFTASTNILLRFVKQQDQAQMDAAAQLSWLRLGPTSSNTFPILVFVKTNSPVVAELTVLLSGSAKNDSAINLNDSSAREKIQNVIRATVGRNVNGAQGFQISELPLSRLSPAHIVLRADAPPSAGDLEKLIPPDLVSNIGRLAITMSDASKMFQVRFVSGRVTAAADYLNWSDQFVPAFDEVRAALKRPCAIIPGDYSTPYLIPIPNYVTMRSLAQTLAQRAQCDFLLNRPEDALREVTLMHDMCRILEKPPTGQPMTLVEAMIHVAISGLYAATVADGFRLNAWREPQIVGLQAQFKATRLLPSVFAAFAAEQASSTHTLETTPAAKIAGLFNMVDVGSGKNKPGSWTTIWKNFSDPMYLFFRLCPRGWIYRNMITAATDIRFREGINLEQETMSPSVYNKSTYDLDKSLQHVSPFNVWARVGIPNYLKAWQTTAYNQTLANEGQIVCALERYQLAHGNYPETLDALMPQFIEKIPHDLIGGEPLHYRRTDDGKFILYSVGWNETDDGGLPGTLSDAKKGDWLWQYPAK